MTARSLLESQTDRGEYIERRTRINLVRIVRGREVPFAIEQIFRVQTPLPKIAAVAHGRRESRPAGQPYGVLVVCKHRTHVPCADTCADTRCPALVQPRVHRM